MNIAKRMTALLLAVAMVTSLLSLSVVTHAQGDLTISTAEEFLEFSQMCIFDSYSDGLTVTLMADIDMTDLSFEDIPIFLGTFDGNGYTITGVDHNLDKDTQGLFRYVSEGATISNLTVIGSCTTEYHTIGGIVAENHGTIENCNYQGIISGTQAIGGIAGKNYGTILNCTVYGGVFGETQIGGIAGVNSGSIIRCYNYAQVNTQISDFEFSYNDILTSNINPDTTSSSITDIGGIVGSSDGIIKNCANHGTVGYPHVGYNIGGIAGIQSGYISGCTNYGTVYGRKEVGGIVGQFEPYVDTLYSTSKLQSLRDELDTLSGLTTNFTQTADESNAILNASMSQLGSSVEESKNYAETLIDQTEDVFNANIASANQVSVTVADTLDGLIPITDSFDDVTASLSDGVLCLENSFGYFAQASEALDDVGGILDNTTDHLLDAGDSLTGAIDQLQDALSLVAEEEGTADLAQYIQNIGNDLSHATQSLSDANQYLSSAMNELEGFIAALADDFTNADDALTDLENATDLTSFRDALVLLLGSMDSLSTLGDVSDRIFDDIDLAQESTDAALAYISSAMDEISLVGEAMEEISDTIHDVSDELLDASQEVSDMVIYLQDAISETSQLSDVFDEANDALQDGLSALEDGMGYFDDAIQNLEVTNDLISQLITDISDEEVAFTPFDDSYRDTRDLLSTSLSQVMDDMAQVNSTSTLSGDLLIDDLEAINLQFTLVLDLALEIIQDVSTYNELTLIEDISTFDTSEIFAGKVTDCENTAYVEGDINVGGIAGAISFEIAFDPEDDLTSQLDKTQTISYQGIAIIEDSVNTGDVVAKKDCAGGILGYQDFGLVQGCTANATVESTEGNYVGGIVGQSSGYIRNCYGKTTLSGAQFVGGIVGSGYDIQGCYSLATLSATKGAMGGIVGELATDGTLLNNFFVSDILGGLDGISYAGKAEAISYDDLLLVEGLPSLFSCMYLHFYVDDVKLDTLIVEYGQEIDPASLPEIPEREGYYSHWTDFDTTAITADLKLYASYSPLLTTISGEKSEVGIATILVDGNFSDEDILMVTQQSPSLDDVTEEFSLWVEGPNPTITAIRYLAPDDDVTIELYVDGLWVAVDTTVDGAYIIIPVDRDGIIQFRAIPTPPSYSLSILVAGGVIAIILLTSIHSRRKGKKKDDRATATPSEVLSK